MGPSLNKKNQTFLLVVVPQFNHFPLFSLCFYRFYTWQVKQNNAKSSHRLLTHPFFSEQFNDFNGALFNIRTRSLNNFCYWLSQIVGSLAIGLLLDQRRLTRRARAFLGWSVLLMMVFAVHTWAYFYQRYVFSSWKEEMILISSSFFFREYTRETVAPDINDKMDFQDPGYPPRLCLYILCGALPTKYPLILFFLKPKIYSFLFLFRIARCHVANRRVLDDGEFILSLS